MRYMLMMHAPRGTGDYAVAQWSPEDLRRHVNFMQSFNAELKAAGEFVDGQGLTPPNEAKLVRAGKEGRPVTDGPFAETKEFLAGFWLIDVPTAERAYARAAQASAAPGPGGAPMNMPIEVRQVGQAPRTD